MKRVREMLTRKTLVIGGLILALAGVGVAAFYTHAAAQESYANRVTLGRDVVKLAIVVMANQTPVTAADARAILPVLEDIRSREKIDEEAAAQLAADLQSALSAPLQSAVDVVRLPEPKPEARAFMLRMAERHHFANPAKYGPPSHAFDRLVEFFEKTAGK
ncbi:MAG: hypothetical protein ACYC7E_21565 [Armatimonadota bacterium]